MLNICVLYPATVPEIEDCKSRQDKNWQPDVSSPVKRQRPEHGHHKKTARGTHPTKAETSKRLVGRQDK
jgi:hypothetical protein